MVKKGIKFFLYGVGLAGCMCNVSAAQVIDNAYAKSGFAVGVEAGLADIDSPRNQLFRGVPASSQINKAYYFGWGAHLGWFHAVNARLMWGLEVGYKDFGRAKYDSTLTETYAGKYTRIVKQWDVNALLTAKYLIYKNKMNFFAKAGPAYVGAKTEQSSNAATCYPGFTKGISKEDAIRPEAEIGVGWMFNNYVNVFVSLDHIFAATNDHNHYVNNVLSMPTQIYGVTAALAGISVTFRQT